MRRYALNVCLVSLTTLFVGPPAIAQSVVHFLPAQQTGGLELRVARKSGKTASLEGWPERELGWLFVREEGTQRNYSELVIRPEEPTLLRVERELSGVALVGWDRPARLERVAGAQLLRFIEERVGGTVLPPAVARLAQSESLDLRRLESLTLLVSAKGQAGTSSAIATSKGGQRMELRPLLDPTSTGVGSDFAFRLNMPEGEVEVLVARATQLGSGETRGVEFAPGGHLRTRLDRGGPWMIEAHALRKSAASGSELELVSVTLVFEVRPDSAQKADR